jgi:hypothetical protein
VGRQLPMGRRGGHGSECGVDELEWVFREEEVIRVDENTVQSSSNMKDEINARRYWNTTVWQSSQRGQ